MSTGPTYYTATDRRCEDSEVEKEIVSKLQGLGIPLVPQVKLGNNWVFDGAVNGTKILVEIHGDYWHNRPEVRERDGRKQEWADQNGYLILTIWENEYQQDPDGALLTILEHYEAVKTFVPAPDAASHAKHGKHGTDRVRRSDYGDWRDAFLEALSETGIILDACDAVGKSRETVRRHRIEDLDFNEKFKDARRDAADRLRRRYHTRAEQQSDRAMEFLLKNLDPEEYGDSMAAIIQAVLQYLDMSKLSNEQIDRLAAGEDPLRVLLGT
jgi:very-short-patch-repair endonuclease